MEHPFRYKKKNFFFSLKFIILLQTFSFVHLKRTKIMDRKYKRGKRSYKIDSDVC